MAQTYKVDIKTGPMRFDPASITIAKGNTVVWTNTTPMEHTVTPDNGEFPSSGHIKPGETFSHVFGAPDSIAYHCQIPFMKGTVIVS
jgi:plastocyanin